MLLSQLEIERLTESYDTWHVSIYMPTHPVGAEKQQDPIRLKNALQEAEERLLESGLRKSEIEDFLAPARRLLNNTSFWNKQSDGLVLFLAMKHTIGLRVTAEEEEEGLDIGEHGGEAYTGFAQPHMAP